MKDIIYLLLFPFLLLIAEPANAQDHKALLIAIGNYPPGNGFRKIASLNDIPYVQRALEKLGFKDHITILKDQEATAKGIGEALKKLVDEATRGDKIVIHISSHGGQVADDNGDEADGYDECIVGYNAKTQMRSMDFSKDKTEYFRDDQFGFYIQQLQQKLGKEGDILVLIDACHSGTGTRGQAEVRGGEPPLQPAGYIPLKHKSSEEGLFDESAHTRGNVSDMAGYVVISAARQDELDYETKDDTGQPVGPLSFAISKVFEKLNPKTTYRSAFASLQIAMDQKISNSLQHPVLEGTGLDREVFGGKYLPYTPAIEIDRINGRELTVKSGKLFGLEEGTKVALFRASATNSLDSSYRLSYGRVLKSGVFDAVISLDSDPVITRPVEGKIFVMVPVYKIDPVRIGFYTPKNKTGSIFSKEQMAAISTKLKALPIVSIQNDADLYLVKGQTEDSIKIASNGYVFQTVKDLGNNANELPAIIEQFSQYRFLKSLNINQNDPRFSAEIKLVPVINGRADTSMINASKRNGVYQFYEGDTLALLITNKSTRPFYINILDLQPDGIINKILPNREKGIYPSELKFEAGESRLIDKYSIQIWPPYGNELLKIFISDREIDMESIATSRGASSKGDLSFLESLLNNSYHISQKRGGEGISLAGTNGSTYDILFEIKEKK